MLEQLKLIPDRCVDRAFIASRDLTHKARRSERFDATTHESRQHRDRVRDRDPSLRPKRENRFCGHAFEIVSGAQRIVGLNRFRNRIRDLGHFFRATPKCKNPFRRKNAFSSKKNLLLFSSKARVTDSPLIKQLAGLLYWTILNSIQATWIICNCNERDKWDISLLKW